MEILCTLQETGLKSEPDRGQYHRTLAQRAMRVEGRVMHIPSLSIQLILYIPHVI